MPTWTSVIHDAFARADTTPGGAGSTTGVGNGWTDFRGGNFSISGGTLKGFQDSSTPGFLGILYRAGSAYRDQKGSLTTVPTADANTTWFHAFRVAPGSTNWYVCDFEATGSNLRIWACIGGNGNFITQANIPYDPTHTYILEAECYNASPTTLSVTITDVTTSTVYGPLTATDSTAGLQVAGFQGVGGAGAPETTPIHMSSVDLYTGTPQIGSISFTGATSTTISFSATPPTGGTAPIVYQWYASQTSGFTPGSGNLLAGQTGLTLTHTTGTAPGSTWYYVLKVTDADATDLSPPQAAAVQAFTPEVVGLIGDSITAGSGSAPDFCATLAAIAPGHTFSVNNQGISGTTSAAWLPGAGPLEPAITAMLGAGVRHVLIALGVNDAKDGPGYTPISPSAYQTNIASICASLVTAGLTPVLCSPSCTGVGAGAGAFTAAVPGRERAYGAALDALANGSTILRGDRYLWVYSAENVGIYYGSVPDFVHPAPAGQTAMQTLWAYGIASATGLLTPVSGSPSYASAADVRSGVDRGDGTDGTCHVPTAAQVLSGIAVDATAGTVVQPTADQVEGGVAYGPGASLTGTAPSPASVADVVWAYGNRTITS